MTKFGIIGGTGLYDLPHVTITEAKQGTTPFGEPSSLLSCGTAGKHEIVFIARHGTGHTILPEEINYRANIYAMKREGVTHIIGVSAVGSLQENIHPGEFIAIDQFFDRTRKQRKDTFFGNGITAHIAFSEPVCEELRRALVTSAQKVGSVIHDGGTYINMEGPAFSTRAESEYYHSQLQAAVIGMTNLTEAKLAREAEICYATFAQVTDYDSWRAEEAGVSTHDILETIRKNTRQTLRVLGDLLATYEPSQDCSCRHSLKTALITPLDTVPEETLERLDAILSPYMTKTSL
jgi:5'-methylthioadenosine phosphorylase